MGLLASIASNLGKSGGEYAETLAKISAEKEAREAKDKAEIEKEARIEEAWSKRHDITRGEQMVDEVAKQKHEDDPSRLSNKLVQSQLDKSSYEYEQLKDPGSIHNRKEKLGLDATQAQIDSADASTKRSRTETGMLGKKEAYQHKPEGTIIYAGRGCA